MGEGSDRENERGMAEGRDGVDKYGRGERRGRKGGGIREWGEAN